MIDPKNLGVKEVPYLSLVKIEDEVSTIKQGIYERNFNDEDFLTVSLLGTLCLAQIEGI